MSPITPLPWRRCNKVARMKSLVLALGLSLCGGLQAAEFSFSSPTIKEGQTLSLEQVFNGFGCTGKNLSPALLWANAPAGTQSFALTVYDPDAPTGSGWWHWVVYNIPASSAGLAAGAGTQDGALLPKGSRQGRTDFGTLGFGGACPPPGDKPHRYQFTLHALKVPALELPADATAAMIGYNINANTLAKRSFTALYGR
jgi:Raf kinase inhibitor-like YbhB/YbcL family protein